MNVRLLASMLVSLLLLLGGSGMPAPTHAASAVLHPSLSYPTPIHHVIIIAMENRELSQVVGVAPFQTYLYRHFAPATQYYAICHGIADYLSITSGRSIGCGTGTYHVYNVSEIARHTGAAGGSWVGYDQGMPTPCNTSDYPAGQYVVRHNPLVWYGDIVGNASRCRNHVVALPSASTVFGQARNFEFVTPNVTNDCHSATESTCDAWLKAFLNPTLNNTRVMNSSAILIWYDEGTTNRGPYNTTGGGQTYLVAVCTPCTGHNYTSVSNNFNVLTTIEWLLGLSSLGAKDNSTAHPPMKSLFGY